MLTLFELLGPRLPPCSLSALVKTVCNAWCTSHRFPGATQACIACGLRRGDNMRHILECPIFDMIGIALPDLPSAFMLGDGEQRIRVWDFLSFPRSSLLSIAVYIDVVYTVYHDLKHRQCSRSRIVAASAARIQQLIRRQGELQGLIGQLPAG